MIRFLILFAILTFYSAIHGQPEGYYDGTEGLTGQELREALHEIIDDHIPFSYDDLRDFILKETDEDPDDPDHIILIYSGISRDKEDFGGGSGEWNREHTWAKSHGGFDNEPPEGTDAHHVRPADVQVNGTRANLDFDNGGEPVPGCPGCRVDGDSFEPRDEVKGDVARMIFYMATRYMGGEGELYLDVVDEVNTSPEPKHGKLSVLMEWHSEDPPDDFEKNRNEVVYGYQGNRNPFIDHPEFVAAIWGDPTKIKESSADRFIIYPNPFSSVFHIRNIHHQTADYYLYHSNGTLTGKGSITDQEMIIDLEELSAGLYLLMIINPSGHQPEYHRIVKN